MFVTRSRRIRSSVSRGFEPLDQHGARPGARHHAEPRVEAVDVEERQDQEYDVVRPHRRGLDPGALVEVGQQRAVAQHRPLGPSAGARGEEQHGEVLAAGVRLDRSPAATGLDEVAEARHVDDGALGGVDRLPDRGQGRLLGDDHTRVGLTEQVRHLPAGVAGVDRHDHQPRPQRREVGGDEVGSVRQAQGHPVAGREPELADEGGRGGVDGRVQIGPGGAGAVVDEGCRVGTTSGAAPDQVGEVAISSCHEGESGTGKGHAPD